MSLVQWMPHLLEWLLPAALVLAAIFPFLRAGIRKCQGVVPCFVSRNVVNDVAGGFLIPQYGVLILSPLYPAGLTHIEPHAFLLAGVMGFVYTLSDLMEKGPISGPYAPSQINESNGQSVPKPTRDS